MIASVPQDILDMMEVEYQRHAVFAVFCQLCFRELDRVRSVSKLLGQLA